MATKEVPRDPQKVARIMQAACHAFATHGYAETKTETIAAAAQVSKGLLFHYYGSKQQLYLATVQQAMQTIMTTINPQFATPKDLVTLVVQGTRYKTEFGRTHPDEMSVMIAAYGEINKLPASLQAQLNDSYTSAMAVSRKLISDVIDQMAIRPELDREPIIDLIMGVYNQIFAEFQNHMRQNPDIKTMDDAQWIVERAKVYMGILENGFVTHTD